jgi:hypothetical protein
MRRQTKLEIQRALLAGESVTWTDASKKPATLCLSDAAQRRLFQYLLDSDVREPKGLPEAFIDGLATALGQDDDPSQDARTAAISPNSTGPWKLQTIETEGFGGLNTCDGPSFVLQLDRENLSLQGPNGSGKSSLIGAVMWALTGERPRDHSDAKPEASAARVFGVGSSEALFLLSVKAGRIPSQVLATLDRFVGGTPEAETELRAKRQAVIDQMLQAALKVERAAGTTARALLGAFGF